ncbi:hypothetical protein C8A00DRAFT_17960 [Chaetomidium leptoderma]|uniref:Uncharacterized protein n=1 Tax=Chaetomidium leptoderma TaxID=669021 RepID=A0AAN6VFX2_9PEZI|nr:hypothetical protein C8A00DRAFT_17960 [Chaetomidium leptoderma]
MAAPFHQMPPDRFAAIKAKALVQVQPTNKIPYDKETMALMVALLNHQYREWSVHFALVGEPELGLASFPAPPRNNFFFFYQDDGVWSAAWVDRTNKRLGMFTGAGSTSGCRDRRRRLYDILDCGACIGTLGIAKSSLDALYAPDVYSENPYWSGAACLAWAEGSFCQNCVPAADLGRDKQWTQLQWSNTSEILSVLESRLSTASFHVLTGA